MVNFQAYNDAGTATNTANVELASLEKKSFLVKDIFPEQDIADGEISWMTATTTSDVVGF